MTAAARVVRGTAALAVLVALLGGVPAVLVAVIGWPGPRHWPSPTDLVLALADPFSTTTVSTILVAASWAAWAVFVVDLAACLPGLLRGTHPLPRGRVHGLVALLITTISLTLLPDRAHATTTAAPEPADTALSSETSPRPDVVIVRAPRHGIHDTLWRIAERHLGDGTRWHELFLLNCDRPQPDGERLTDPHHIRPGWQLHLPTTKPPAPAETTPLPPAPAGPAPEPARTPAPHQQHGASRHHELPTPPAIALPDGGLVAASLAAAVTAAMLLHRRRRRRSYRPGDSDTGVAPHGGEPAPTVAALRHAHHNQSKSVHDHGHDEDEQDEVVLDFDSPAPRRFDAETIRLDSRPGSGPDEVVLDPPDTAFDDELPPPAGDAPDPAPESHSGTTVDIGVDRDGRTRVLDLAATGGLGLTGPGAPAAARSLLVHLTATTEATLHLTADDAAALLGPDFPNSPRLRIVDDLTDPVHDEHPGPVVLAGTAPPANPDLQSRLETQPHLAALFLGHWPPGATCRVTSDGHITATTPTLSSLHGCRLFSLGATDTRDLLTLLTKADANGPADGELEPGLATDHAAAAATATEETAVESPAPSSGIDGDAEGDAPANTTEDHQQRHTGDRFRPALELAICGPLTLTHRTATGERRDLTCELAPKHYELLAYLGLHRRGVTLDALRNDLWPHARGRRPNNAFFAAVSQIRRVLQHHEVAGADTLTTRHGPRIQLNPELITVDYWHLAAGETQLRTATTNDQRHTARDTIIATYHGELADGLSALWLDGPREHALRSVIDALSHLADHHRASGELERALQHLEHARELAPETEATYCAIMRLQAELGRSDAIARTLHLLTSTLRELGQRPHTDTLRLARDLQARATNTRPESTTPAADGSG